MSVVRRLTASRRARLTHDDLSGRFESWGQTYIAGTLHSAHWKSWKKSDGSYGAKMTSAWDY